MSDDQDSNPAPTPQATPASNQNLIIGLVMGALVLLLAMLVFTQQFGGFGKKDSENEELAEIKDALVEAKKSRDAARDAALGLNGGQDANILVGNIKRDADALVQVIATNQGELARLRGLESQQQDSYAKIGMLQSQLSQAQGAQGQVASLQAQLQSANQRIQQLTEQVSQSVDQSIVANMRAELAQTKKEREDLRTQWAELQAQMRNMIDRAEYDRLVPENRRLRAELQELRARLNDASKLFVERDRLSPKAARLFQELVRLEKESATSLKQAYRRLEQDLNARVMERATFRTGSSALELEHESHIENVIASSPAEAFFLVVGYASTSGDSQNNRKLSRDRAIRTASVVDYLKQKGQKVQAVYLGETKRFGPSNSENQVCEVWEIH